MSVKNVMKMNDEQTMNFIDYYEKEEVLWNTKLQAYRNRDARGEAVKRIVSAMNIEGFGPDHVISKFKNLRSSYCQELKKIASSEKSGTSVEDIYVPHVIWFSKMNSFLKPYVTMRDTCSNYVFLAIALPIDLRGPADLFISANFESSYALPSNQTELTYPPIYSLGREFIYKFLESKLNSHGYHGKYCLQRLICEAAEYTSINSGVLGDIVHVLLTPSSSSEDKKLLKYYTEPEEYGRKNGHCKKYSKKCPFSILNLFSSVKHLFNIKYPE